MPRLKTTYEKEIVAKLMSKLSLKNKHDVPKIVKIILNMGLGEDASDGKKLKACSEAMALISGQKPVITKFNDLVATGQYGNYLVFDYDKVNVDDFVDAIMQTY